MTDLDRLREALEKIDAIRNSIIGCQTVNWSEHIYPLVAALGEAGYPGEEYEVARENVGTLIEQIKAAEAENVRLRAAPAATPPGAEGWKPIESAPRDRTIVGKFSQVRFLCAWVKSGKSGAWYVKDCTDPEGCTGEKVEPQEWCEVP